MGFPSSFANWFDEIAAGSLPAGEPKGVLKPYAHWGGTGVVSCPWGSAPIVSVRNKALSAAQMRFAIFIFDLRQNFQHSYWKGEDVIPSDAARAPRPCLVHNKMG
jgi:hypothetical protein